MLYFSPAKINLFFRILGKRGDGYHDIASLLQAIDLYDQLEFSKGPFDSLTCSDPNLSCGSDNLVMKALKLFRIWFPMPFGVHIHLEKRIPMQAGLGGGSSNAATTLFALNEMCGRPASVAQLIEIGALLGSDVPFFFSEGTAHCTGRGEVIEARKLQAPLSGWLSQPPFGLSTPLVYKETRPEDFGSMKNDLQPAAFRLEPRLIDFHNRLKERGFETISMTGSGTAFFCFGSPSHTDGLIPFRSVQRSGNGWYEDLTIHT